MIKKIKNYLLLASSALMLSVPMLAPAFVSAACSTNTANQIAGGANQAAGANGQITCDSSDLTTSGIGQVASHLVNIFSIIVGIVAVIMIIYGGFRYITSGGDSSHVGNAKNTLIYAIVGLVIVALAQVIVHFVLSSTNGVTS